MLWREGSAWAALLALHGTVRGMVHQVVASAAEDDHVARQREHVDTREAAYCAALTGLASQADALASEALKLRSLRRMRAGEEVRAIATLLEAHTNEVLAMGSALAGNSALSMQTATAALRQANQAARAQVTQLHALVQTANESAAQPPLRFSISIENAAGEARALPVDAVLQEVYCQDTQLSETSLRAALQALSVGGASQGPTASAPPRSLARRHGDRSSAGGPVLGLGAAPSAAPTR